jgi:hypothetical protein
LVPPNKLLQLAAAGGVKPAAWAGRRWVRGRTAIGGRSLLRWFTRGCS